MRHEGRGVVRLGAPILRLMLPIREEIERLRAERGWTQQQLAERSGIPLRTLSGYLAKSEPVTPGIAHLARLADAFNVPLDDVVGRDWSPPIRNPTGYEGAHRAVMDAIDQLVKEADRRARQQDDSLPRRAGRRGR